MLLGAHVPTVGGIMKAPANDAKTGRGSRVDRHAPGGRGVLGIETFRRFVNDPRFEGIPAVVETPGPLEEWRRQIELLRSLRVSPPASSASSPRPYHGGSRREHPVARGAR